VQRLETELAAAQAKATDAENRLRGLGEELADAPEGAPSRHKFEEVLRVAEDQAGVLLRNATDQGDRLLTAAREEIENRRKEAQAEAEAITSRAQHDAQQVHLRIETELTAHQARIEREAAHAAEKVVQAEREAAAIRTEAEKGAAALRSMVAGGRRDGVRRAVPASDPPDRAPEPQGTQQHTRPAAGRPRLALGHRVRRGRP
jgi:chromosome segregation ATPase